MEKIISISRNEACWRNVGSNFEKPTFIENDRKLLNIIKQMNNLNVKHYLDVYKTRKEMQEKGITNPSEQIKKFTRDFVDKLQTYSLDEEITVEDNGSFFDSKGNLIMKLPD